MIENASSQSLVKNDAVITAQVALQKAINDFTTRSLEQLGIHCPENTWALAPDVLQLLVSLVHHLKPKHILEFGSGLSTKVLSIAATHAQLCCQITSIDHDPEFLQATENRLADKDLADKDLAHQKLAHQKLAHQKLAHQNLVHQDAKVTVQLLLAPLIARMHDDKVMPLYALKKDDLTAQIPADLIIVDGPPGVLGGRAGILYQAMNFARPGTLVLLDDADRKEEQAAMMQWQNTFGDAISVTLLPGFVKGLAAIMIHQPVPLG